MEFRSPYLLSALAILPALVYLLLRRISVLNELRNKLSLPRVPARLSYLVASFLALCVFAFSQPYLGTRKTSFDVQTRDVVILFDISKSMWAEDVPPNRYEAARRAALDVVKALSDPSFSIGLVSFSGSPFTLSPLSSDKSSLRKVLQELPTIVQPEEGSSINSAISQAIRLLAGSKRSTIIMISDGEDSTFVEDFALNQLIDAHITLFTIPIGTKSGSAIREPNGTLIKDDRGNTVITKLNDSLLKGIAERSGGDLIAPSEIFSKLKLDRDPIQLGKRDAISYNEVGYILLLIAAIGIAGILTLPDYRVILPVLFLISLLHLPHEALADNYSSYKQYKKGDYSNALKGFGEALAKEPSDLDVLQAFGSAQFKQKNFSGAEESFKKLANSAKDVEHKFDGYYNLGNSLLAQDKFDEAVAAYDQSLKIINEETRAKTNREIALKRKEEQKSSSDSNKSEQDDKDKGDQEPQDESKESKDDKQDQRSQENKGKDSEQKDESNKDSSRGAGTPIPTAAPSDPTEFPTQAPSSPDSPEDSALKALESLPDSPPIVPKRNPQNRAGYTQRW